MPGPRPTKVLSLRELQMAKRMLKSNKVPACQRELNALLKEVESGVVSHAPEPELTETKDGMVCDENGCAPNFGRRCISWAADQGVQD